MHPLKFPREGYFVQSSRVLYLLEVARYLAHSCGNKRLIDYCLSVIRCIAKRLVDILTMEELLK